jgi:imidazole glycerol-phosphate synthase subunit HisH
MIVIIDYGMGNVHSVKNALDFLGYDALISNKEEDIRKADKLILPGVGAFRDGMKNLERFNLIKLLDEVVLEKKKPIIGICLGMQLLCKTSEEGGIHEGLCWIDADVRLMEVKSKNLKLPHVGWNNIAKLKDDALLKGVSSGSDFYFVHSYQVVPKDGDVVTSTCDYGTKFAATIRKDNIFGAQFHPEKSQALGLKILENFAENA